MTEKKLVVDGPVSLGGAVGRIVEFEDGSGMVETWGANGWEAGGADIAEIMAAPWASANLLTAVGVPEEDWPEHIRLRKVQ